MKRRAFTLIELLVSITILSIIMVFLYKTYDMINRSNTIIKNQSEKIIDIQKIKKVIYMDFLLAQKKSIHIKNIEKGKDFVTMQSSNSIHQRYNPYITYILKEDKLYRLESLEAIKEYNIEANAQFDIDKIGDVTTFKVYKSTIKDENSYLINIIFKNLDEILLKVKSLN